MRRKFYSNGVFNLPPSELVQDLLSRAGGRAEVLVHFSAARLRSLRLEPRRRRTFRSERRRARQRAVELGANCPSPWPNISPRRCRSSAARPRRPCPGSRIPTKPEQNYFAKVFYEGEPATEEQGGGPLVSLLFPGLDQLARELPGRGRPEEARDHRRAGQRRRARFQQPDHGHPVQCRGDAGQPEPDARRRATASSTSSAPAPPAPR